MIKPAIPIPAPAKIMANNLGTRLIKKICVSNESQFSKSIGFISIAPINSDITDRMITVTINIHSLIFNPIFLLLFSDVMKTILNTE